MSGPERNNGHTPDPAALAGAQFAHRALPEARTVAYFSMEVGIDPAMPTYSGGLGVLAGDTIRAAADLSVPMVAVTLLHRNGYFKQRLDPSGNQTEVPHSWSPEQFLEPLPARVSVELEGRPVTLRPWRYNAAGQTGFRVPVYFLDSSLPENDPGDRTLTDNLYGGDDRYRLCQEVLLGIGGVAMLRTLGYGSLRTFHMNEGHSALLTLALLEEAMQTNRVQVPGEPEVALVRQKCVFTTHTPVAAGHDRFWKDLFGGVVGARRSRLLESVGLLHGGQMTMTDLGLRFSRYVNGVSMRHARVSQAMFPGYVIHPITNGVHGAAWTSEPFARLFDRYAAGWRSDNRYLRNAVGIPLREVLIAHDEAKRRLLREAARRGHVELDPAAFTIGFARRATAYKRGDLLLTDIERLRRMAASVGPIQILFAGKAHPRDDGGKDVIRRIFAKARELAGTARVVYLEDYDLTLGALLTSGVDLWVNNPQPPLEASGTSGMKAALNGVPSLSVLDGWWVEGHVEGVTGWSIGEATDDPADTRLELASLYDKLERLILPMFYSRHEAWATVMRFAISLNGSYFNAHRMLAQYLESAYVVGAPARATVPAIAGAQAPAPGARQTTGGL
jgi:starch phosphorylase